MLQVRLGRGLESKRQRGDHHQRHEEPSEEDEESILRRALQPRVSLVHPGLASNMAGGTVS